MERKMTMFKAYLSLLAILSIASGYALAACPDDVNFKQPRSQQLSVPIGYSMLGDIDGDGKKDLVGVTMSTQRRTDPVNIVFYKRSAAGFDIAPVVTSVGSAFRTNGFELIDTNNDGKVDLVNFSSDGGVDTTTTYLGNGAGGFTLGASTVIGISSNHSMGDVNGDNRPDLVTAWNGTVRLFLMQADGTFGSAISLGTGTFGFIRDFNNDGQKDILIWYHSPGRKVLYNQGNAVFIPGPEIPNISAPFLGDFKDLNGDGRLDFVSSVYISGGNAMVAVYLGQADGGFTATEKNLGPSLTTSPGWPTAVTDADGDGDADFLVFGYKMFAVGTNDGSGQFTTSTSPTPYDIIIFGGNLPATLDDFNGDGRPDLISVNRELIFKNMSDVVKIRENTCSRVGQTKFVDFDGDGQTDLGYFRASDGTWLYRSTRTDTNVSITGFGATGDLPAPQDFDGDAITDRAYFRPSDGNWYVMGSLGSFTPFHWGMAGDKPVPSDYDGDGKADIAIYRPSNGTWWILNSSDGNYFVYNFGISEDIPVPMDYDGDGKSDVAVFRPSTGVWYIQKSGGGGYYIIQWGLGTDIPMPGDYDNDGQADLGIYRPSNGQWWMYRLRDNVLALSGLGGAAGDIPVPITRPAYGFNVAIFRSANETLIEKDIGGAQSYPGFSGNKVVSTIIPQN
jgi:hypothetical protein